MSKPKSKLLPLTGWWLVYPGSEKLDLGPKAPIAVMKYEAHADAFIAQHWPGIGYKVRVPSE